MHSHLLYVIACRRIDELGQESSRAQLAHYVARTGTSRRLKVRPGPSGSGPTRPECHADAGSSVERNAAVEPVWRSELAAARTRGLSGVRYSEGWVE